MKSFGQYFKYHFKSTFLRFVIMTVIVLALSLLFFDEIVRAYYYVSSGDKNVDFANVHFGLFTMFFATLCVIVPMFELSGFKNRRNLDTIFSLPVSRTKMILAHALNGWLHITAIFTVEVGIMFAALRLEKEVLYESYLFGYYGAMLLLGLCVYLFFLCIFSQANTVGDGVVFVLSWSFVFALAVLLLKNEFYVDMKDPSLILNSTVFISSFKSITEMFMLLVEEGTQNLSPYGLNQLGEVLLESKFALAFWGVIGVASAILLYFTFNKKRVEKVEDISDSPLGYKFLTPFIVLSCILLIGSLVSFLGVFLLIIMLVSYIVYRRTIRIKKWDIVMLGIAALTVILRSVAQ